MATVTRGKTWLTGDVLNVSTMNDAALPTVAVADNEVTTAKINDGAVTNAKIASGVDAAKLTTGTLPVARLAAGSVTLDKLENVTAGRVVLGNASNVPTGTAVSGDITITSSGVTSIGSAKVTSAKLDGVAKDNSGGSLAVGTAPVFGCRAFVNFDGTRDTTNSVSTTNTNRLLKAAGNVSSVTRNATGRFTINFDTAMPDANYAVSLSLAAVTAAGGRLVCLQGVGSTGATNKTASSVTIETAKSDSGTLEDLAEVSVAIFR